MESIESFVRDPYNPELNFKIGTEYYDSKQFASAFTYFQRCAEYSNDPHLVSESLLICSKVLAHQENRSQKEYDMILHSLSIGTDCPEVFYTKSMYHMCRGEWTECYAICCLGLNTLKSFSPKFRNQEYFNYESKNDLLFQKALSGFKRGKLEEARKIFIELKSYDMLKNFPGSFHEPVRNEYNFSQCFQDVFVEFITKNKENGTYLEIGAGDYRNGNNTYLLETKYNWKGLSIDFNDSLVNRFNSNRSNKCFHLDATKVDYKSFLEENNYPREIDYLQLDCDPADVTYQILEKIPFDDYKFRVITYEHDYYNDYTQSFREKSRKFLRSKGYLLVVGNVTPERFEECPFEDWWVHPELVCDIDTLTDDKPIFCEKVLEKLKFTKREEKVDELKSHFDFFKCHDQLGYDICYDRSLPLKDLLKVCLESDQCVAVNTHGYFKSKVEILQKCMDDKNGIYVKKFLKQNFDSKNKIPVLGVLVCTGCYYLKKFLDSIDYPVENLIIINNNSDQLMKEVDNIVSQGHPMVSHFRVLHASYNMGCAESWNTIIKSYMFSPYWVISNDDVNFEPGFLEELNVKAQDKEVGIIFGNKQNGESKIKDFCGSWELFLMKEWLVKSHGFFDTNFYPAYSEDVDYTMRLINKPVKSIIGLEHSVYSGDSNEVDYEKHSHQTRNKNLKIYSRMKFCQRTNADLILKKWGVYPDNIVIENLFKNPYDNSDFDISYTHFDLDHAQTNFVDFNCVLG